MDTIKEQIYKWIDMDSLLKEVIAVSMSSAFCKNGIKVDKNHMMRLLNLASPKCVFGHDGEKLKYSRIHKDSISVMNLICENYLQEN